MSTFWAGEALGGRCADRSYNGRHRMADLGGDLWQCAGCSGTVNYPSRLSSARIPPVAVVVARRRRISPTALVLLVILAVLLLAALTGCSGQRPTVDAAPVPTESATAEAAPDWVTCADWNAQVTTPDQLPLVIPQGLSPADEGKFRTGLGNYCRALPDDPLFIASDSVMLCLWPDQAQQLRGPDCAAVRGELEG